MTNHRLHHEWVLNHIVEIDRHHPGFCGAFFRTSAERRQVIAAYLEAKPPADGEMPEVGHLLSSANHRSILREAHTDVPGGHRGALSRSGPVAHERRFYSLLHRLLAQPAHPNIARTIAGLPTLDVTKLLIVKVLPLEICRVSVVELVDSERDATDIADAFALITERGLDRAELALAIRKARTESELAGIWKRAVQKLECPSHPVTETDKYRPVAKVEDLSRLARRYRNCAQRYSLNLASGSDAFAEFHHGDAGAVVHLRMKRRKWNLEGVFAQSNAQPSASLRQQLDAHLLAHDVVVGEQHRRKPSEWDPLRRLVQGQLWEFDYD